MTTLTEEERAYRVAQMRDLLGIAGSTIAALPLIAGFVMAIASLMALLFADGVNIGRGLVAVAGGGLLAWAGWVVRPHVKSWTVRHPTVFLAIVFVAFVGLSFLGINPSTR